MFGGQSDHIFRVVRIEDIKFTLQKSNCAFIVRIFFFLNINNYKYTLKFLDDNNISLKTNRYLTFKDAHHKTNKLFRNNMYKSIQTEKRTRSKHFVSSYIIKPQNIVFLETTNEE